MPLNLSRSHVAAHQRHAWHGTSLLVTNARGECGDDDALTGYYYREARHLRALRLTVNGVAPWLCADASAAHDELAMVLAYPELTHFGGGGTDVSDDTTWRDPHGVPQRAIDVRLHHRVGPASLVASATLTNRAQEPVTLEVAWEVAADFADIQEAFSGERQQDAAVRDATEDAATLRFDYTHPQLPIGTRIRAEGAAEWRITPGRLTTRVDLAPRASATLALRVVPLGAGVPDDAGEAARRGRLEAWRASLARVEVPAGDDVGVAALVNQGADDVVSLALLDGAPDEWRAIQAGIPLYPALFGRDALTVGWQTAMFDRAELLDASLARLGRMQSDHTDDWRDAQPGRIPYQVRSGPLARLGLNPYDAYYADFASPLLFVIGLGNLFAWTGDAACVRRHWDVARRILDWARTLGDPDQDGFLEYQTRSPKGTKNQGWKDSGNAILYEDGTPVPAPLGTCELQAYWFAAQQLTAGMCLALGATEDAKAWWRSASELRERFNRDWWLPEDGFFALALDADKRPARSASSNVGHCLAAGIVAPDHVPPVVGRLFAPDLFSGWGIRTLSSAHVAYNPLAYHLGSVWPVENATTVFGLRRFGFDGRALELTRAVVDLATLYERGRIPECVGGYARSEFPQPGAYPRANPMQAWNQSAYTMLLQSLLGLQPVAPLELLVVDPVLPEWLPEVTVRDLRLAGATATLRFVRDASSGRAHAEVVEKRGTLHVVHQPPPESLHAGVGDRVRALFESLMHH
ncbi:Amylo-alpha-16-glucosidase [Gemmatirosa kalamazoonensis]|uniref:Amylo-alpha-16-glucosidase n=1 Tax=Gemmatirosa kalamazoonensis TaxID=861299 RepID=W0RKF9_9BACT|nr:glycogen debranching N-terminal domain-containing protein [Gemmatirosa kalamazoonensis]AHG91579.1 Amylo-alpha-16-glucosidase [Gemmatirosa kalamazoonensis]